MTEFPCRTTLGVIIFFGYLMTHAITANFAIAIIRIVKTNSTTTTTNSGPQFDWTVRQKNDIIGIYLLGYMIFEIMGGRLSEIYGSKRIFGTGVLGAGIVCVIFPFTCHIHYYVAFITRLFMGSALGFTRSSTHSLAVNWFPPSKRSSFMGKAGSTALGDSLALCCSGYIIEYFGWPYTFYLYGTIAIIWACFWFSFVYDSPEVHPHISSSEKAKITEEKRAEKNAKEGGRKKEIPWRQMIKSVPVWAIIIMYSFSGFGQFVYINYIPSYLNNMLHFNIKQSGLLASLPFLASFIFVTASSYCADAMIRSKRISIEFTRKLLSSVSLFGAGTLISLLAIWGENTIFCIAIFVLSYGFKGISYSSNLINALDIAPNYASSISAIGFACAAFCGWNATQLIGLIIRRDDSFNGWKIIFLFVGGAFFSAGLTFLIFAKGEVQPWNSEEPLDEQESLQLRIDKDGKGKVLNSTF